MNYLELIKGLRSEAMEKLQYKKLAMPYSIFAFIAVLPFVVSAFLTMVLYYVLAFLYNCFASAVTYLEGWLKENKKDVQHATEAVLYFVTVPFIFFCHVLLSVFAIFFYFTWFSAQCSFFIATLGGTRWQPFINTASYSADNKKLYARANATASLVFSLVSFVLYAVITVLTVIGLFGGLDYDVMENLPVLHILYQIGLGIAVPIIFKKSDTPDEEKTEEKPVYIPHTDAEDKPEASDDNATTITLVDPNNN
ncbi:MAG: hypothetical protein IJY18_06265 [Clostridia bacterium]|nr:hypothetical protein [Clostridia bacterium]